MLEHTCTRPCRETLAAPGALDRGFAPAVPTPRQNGLLAALPARDYERVRIHLEPVALPQGSLVHRAGDREYGLYFIASGLVSRVYLTRSGASVEFAITGREGVIGVASFLGGGSTPSQALVLRSGRAYRLGADVLRQEFEREGALALVLLRYTQALIAQAGQIATCTRHHSVEQQLCRWLLSCLDRIESSELVMTQEQVATLLGVRRQSVAHASRSLQALGLIRYSRGHIVVRDRAGLEAHVCECYAVIKHEYDRLLAVPGRAESAWPGGTGLSVTAAVHPAR